MPAAVCCGRPFRPADDLHRASNLADTRPGVRHGAVPPPGQQARVQDAVRGFIGQKATHRHVQALFQDHLARQGLVTHWAPRVARRPGRLKAFNVRACLGVTASTKHVTAILADTDPRLQAMWRSHASEEAGHCSTAFDLYRALAGHTDADTPVQRAAAGGQPPNAGQLGRLR